MPEATQTLCLADEELIGSKVNALLTRTTPRDVYDVYSLIKDNKITDETLIRKIAIFYVCLASETPIDFEAILSAALAKISGLEYQRIKETLIPVLHKGVKFDVNEVSSLVSSKIEKVFELDSKDIGFIERINAKSFDPNFLFEGQATEDVSKHPMGIWKTR